jgi:hypothetical protein
MYWNNPIIELSWPSSRDPVQESLHNGNHCLFYNPAVSKHNIYNNQTLQDLCNWINTGLADRGMVFFKDPANFYDIANMVKLNLWVHDLPVRGSIKPMLLNYTGLPKYNSDFNSGTGASRLRAMERIESMQTVAAFITTSNQHKEKFAHLESITALDRFAELCQAVPNQQFLFRLTDSDAQFGIDWYEYNNEHTATVTPEESYCVEALSNFAAENPELKFNPDWFDCTISWDQYVSQPTVQKLPD